MCHLNGGLNGYHQERALDLMPIKRINGFDELLAYRLKYPYAEGRGSRNEKTDE